MRGTWRGVPSGLVNGVVDDDTCTADSGLPLNSGTGQCSASLGSHGDIPTFRTNGSNVARIDRPGTIVGKSFGRLEKGRGKADVLSSLR